VSDRTNWSVQDYEDRLEDIKSLLILYDEGLIKRVSWELERLDRNRGVGTPLPEGLETQPKQEQLYASWLELLLHRPRHVTPLMAYLAYLNDWFGSWDLVAEHVGMPRTSFMRLLARERHGSSL